MSDTTPIVPIRFSKTIVNLPVSLTPDTVFAVRSGPGIDLYVSDMTGGAAYTPNSPLSIFSQNSDTVTRVTSLNFDATTGFSVTDLGGGAAFITQDVSLLSIVSAATRLIQTQRIMAQMVTRGQV